MDQELLHLIFYHTILLSGELLTAIALLHIITKRRAPSSMIAWILAIFLIPYIAVPLYFLFGSRKMLKKHYKEPFSLKTDQISFLSNPNPISTVLQSHNIPAPTIHNRCELIFDGVKAYETLIEQIESAKFSIDICTYIFKYDKTTKQIIKVLEKKAKEGVKVRILMDSLGSAKIYLFPHHLKKLKEAGAKIAFFMPFIRMPYRNFINLRNHRKIYIFDQCRVLSGGINLSGEYIGATPSSSRWKDILYLLEGDAVNLYTQIFLSDWIYATKQPESIPQQIHKNHGNTEVQVTPSGPDVASDAIYEALLNAIYNAKTRIWIVTPYFIPNDDLMRALIIAQHKNVHVKIITPYQSDHILADLGRSSYIRELKDKGIDIKLYKGSMLHAKAILFDNSAVMLGSVNFDNRSLFLNYEVASFVYSLDIIETVGAWMQDLSQHTTISLPSASKIRKLGENFMRILAPLI